IFLEASLQIDARTQGARKMNGILDAELGARADRKVRGVRRIPHQDQVAVMPVAAQDSPEVEPDRRAAQMLRVRHQGVAVQIPCEPALELGDDLRLLHPLEAEVAPGLLVSLDDES